MVFCFFCEKKLFEWSRSLKQFIQKNLRQNHFLTYSWRFLPCPSILYRPKMILDRPNCFGQIQIVLVIPKSFWSDLNHFGQVQIRLFWTNFYDLDPTKKIGPVQNNWYSTKMIWTVQNHFGSIGGIAHFFKRCSIKL